jgi:hypothetical protein
MAWSAIRDLRNLVGPPGACTAAVGYRPREAPDAELTALIAFLEAEADPVIPDPVIPPVVGDDRRRVRLGRGLSRGLNGEAERSRLVYVPSRLLLSWIRGPAGRSGRVQGVSGSYVCRAMKVA